MEILRSSSDADDPVSFSDLREDVGIGDSGQFNYHLDKLAGHFVEQTEEGYVLRQAGDRVIEAILSGAVTHAPEFDLTTIDETCYYCGSPVAVRYSESTSTAPTAREHTTRQHPPMRQKLRMSTDISEA